jgi:hypothetical protein
MENGHTALQPEDIAYLASARAWIKGHFTEHADEKYSSVDGKLRVVSAILENEWIDPEETAKLQCLGVAFGDAVAQQLMMDWVIVEDEYGRDSALNWPGTTIYSYPISMILKRVEDGESPDIYQLFSGLCEQLTQLAFDGRAQ